MTRTAAIALMTLLAGCSSSRSASKSGAPAAPSPAKIAQTTGANAMQLGNFSLSLTVKDIAASRAFYEKLGFTVVAGDQAQNWLVLKNEETKIGLFQGMFPSNTLTFNPGWDSNKATLAAFTDVRELQRALKARGLTPEPAADESTSGPAYFMVMDPDGNPILFDQHVDKPKN